MFAKLENERETLLDYIENNMANNKSQDLSEFKHQKESREADLIEQIEHLQA